ncbi:MAG: polysaccharide export protein [Elusimicrobiaceae bacterium]|nr:polysaccharide export protein [Elusimicrobiaceae bacterium]
MSKRFSLSVCLTLLIAGCAPAQPKITARTAAAEVAVSTQTATDKLDETALLSVIDKFDQTTNYEIQPGDLLEITIYQEPEMNRTVRVSGQGTVNIPLAGNTAIGGITVPKAEELLSEKLSQYLKFPQVSVLIKEYSNKQVYVLGEVKKPGSIELPMERKLSVLEAITLSGGFTEIAAQDRTRILRKKNGKSEFISVQISRITKEGDKNADILLEPSDVVFVPQSFF